VVAQKYFPSKNAEAKEGVVWDFAIQTGVNFPFSFITERELGPITTSSFGPAG
jgi:hypothetical protein